jgi:hypothetical protein
MEIERVFNYLDLDLVIHPEDVDKLKDFILHYKEKKGQLIIFYGNGNNGKTVLEDKLMLYLDIAMDDKYEQNLPCTYIVDELLPITLHSYINNGLHVFADLSLCMNLNPNTIYSVDYISQGVLAVLSNKPNIHIIRFPHNMHKIMDEIHTILNTFFSNFKHDYFHVNLVRLIHSYLYMCGCKELHVSY